MDRQQTWDYYVEWPLTGVAVAFLAAYAWPILDPSLSDGWGQVCRFVTWLAWLLFAGDFAARLFLAHDRWRFVRTHLFDLAVIALPAEEEGVLWAVRPLPSTLRNKNQRRIFTVNVSNMETLFAYYDPELGVELGGHLMVYRPSYKGEWELTNIGHYDTAAAETGRSSSRT